MLWLIPAGAVLIAAALLAYRHFVTDRIMDGGNMENPFVEDGKVLDVLPEDSALKALDWSQSNMSYDDCYSFSLRGGPDEPVIECSFSDPGASEYGRLEIGGDDETSQALPVSPERWAQVESLLKNMTLPSFEAPEPELADAAANALSIERIASDGSVSSVELDGSSADELYSLLAQIAREAAGKYYANAAEGG